MANVRICDRCGKKLEIRTKCRIFAAPHRYQFFKETKLDEEEYDLCAECEKDFDVFMQGPSEGCTAETKE